MNRQFLSKKEVNNEFAKLEVTSGYWERERPGFGVALKEVMGAEHRTEAIEDLRTKFQLNLV